MEKYRNLDGTRSQLTRQAKAPTSAIKHQAIESAFPLGVVVACGMHEAILHKVILGHRDGLRAVVI